MAGKPTYEELEQRVKELEKKAKKYGPAKKELPQTDSHRMLAENFPGIVFRMVINENNRMLLYNNMLQETTGYEPEELGSGEAFSIMPLIIPEDQADVAAAVKHAITNNRPFEIEYQLRHKNGDIRYCYERGRPVNGKDGKPLYVDGIILDITDRKQAEEALGRSVEFINRILNSVYDSLMVIDTDYNIVDVNADFFKQHGKTPKDVIERKCHEVSHKRSQPCDGVHPCPLMAVIESKAPVRMEHIHVDDKGTEQVVEIYSFPLFKPNEEVEYIVEVIHDITKKRQAEEEQKKMQAQLTQAQKMESIGRLAGGMAHDFNNILTTILGYSELALMSLPKGHSLIESFEAINNAAEKAAGLIRQLLAFSRKQVLEMQVINVSSIVDNMAKMLVRLMGEDVTVQLKTQQSIRNIMGDPGQIEQILMNLAVNSRDAMPKGGQLAIETSEIAVDETFAPQHKEIKPGPYVLLSVSDTGEGMSKKIQKDIFEPFFTTKREDRGTGLGLSTAYGIIKQHNGYIHVFSEAGYGTLFNIYFPIVNKADIKQAAKRKNAALAEGTETILIVDDDENIRWLIIDTLRPLGYKILEASGGDEAMALVDSHKDTIDLLLTDVIMPGMNGRELADKLENVKPEIKVVFMSGYTDDVIVYHGVLDPGLSLLHKPLSPVVLVKKLREVLDK